MMLTTFFFPPLFYSLSYVPFLLPLTDAEKDKNLTAATSDLPYNLASVLCDLHDPGSRAYNYPP